jgi:hypothetical protein
MKRPLLGTLLLSLAILGAGAGDAHAFGRGLAKRRAKRRAKDRAKKEVKKKVAEATGVDVGGLVEGDASATAKGMAKGKAEQAVARSVAGPYAKYVGMKPHQIKASLKDEIMKEKGVNRFSPPSQRRSVDTLVERRYGKVMKALELAKSGGLEARASKLAERNAEAVIEGDKTAGEALGDMTGTARADVADTVAPIQEGPAGLVQDAVEETRAQAEKRIRREVYRSKGISSRSPRIKKIMADKEIENRLNEQFR